jgi:hypothetical protein
MVGRRAIHQRAFSRALVGAIVAVVLAGPAASPASAGTTTRATGVARDCHEPMAFVRVPATAVRKHVPSSYTLFEAAPGQATLFVRGAFCEGWNVTGKEVPTFIAQVGALVESPDGGGCMTHGMRDYGVDQLDGNAIELCNYYSFFVATDNRRYVKWLRAGGLERFPVHYTRKFKFRLKPGLAPGEFAFDFSVGGAVPWPFRLQGTGLEREGALPMTIAVWNNVGGKVVKFIAEPDVLLGHAEGTISTAPRTGLAKVLGGTSMSFAGPWSLNYIEQAKLTKEVRSP